MKKQSYLCVLAAAAISLSSCQSPSSTKGDWSNMWNNSVNENEKTPPPPTLTGSAPSATKKLATTSTTTVSSSGKHKVVLPPSYYLAEGTPVSHESSDTAWVDKQDSTGYTIQLASGGSAPAVAQTLQSAPKNARMAQVKYDANGQPAYVGIYGTYPTQAAAQAALDKLPKNLQSTADVQSWSTIQEKVASSSSSSTSTDSSIAPPDITDSDESTQ